jgi:hypothetical protein
MSALVKTFISFEAAETDRNRDYWAGQPWASNTEAIRTADALMLPWHEISEIDHPVYPQGTAEFTKFLRRNGFPDIQLAVREEDYRELAMYGKAWRLPTLVLSLVALPIFTSVVADKLSDMLPGVADEDTIEMELIVERPHSPCIRFSYKGPASRVAETIARETHHCLSEASESR